LHIFGAMNRRIALPISSSWIHLHHGLGLAAILLVGCSSGGPAVKNSNMQGTQGMQPAPSGVATADLSEGHDLFTARCGTCHDLPDPAAHPAEKWPHLVDWMKDRAHLDSTQASSVLTWVLAERTRETAK
jgi:mono/diheme cytochrome c family protein